MVGVEAITIPKQRDGEADTVVTGELEMQKLIADHFREQFEKPDVDLVHYLKKDFKVALDGVFEIS